MEKCSGNGNRNMGDPILASIKGNGFCCTSHFCYGFISNRKKETWKTREPTAEFETLCPQSESSLCTDVPPPEGGGASVHTLSESGLLWISACISNAANRNTLHK